MQGSQWLIWTYTLAAVLAVSAVSLAGAFLLTLRPKTLDDNLHILVSFAVGALFGDAFIHLLPEAFARAENPLPVSLLVLLGIFLFLILERLILWRHGNGNGHSHGQDHDREPGGHNHARGTRPVAILNLIGDGAHNLADGLIIGASFTVSPALGVTTTLAVLLHEIPQELGDFGILVHGGMSHGRALRFNFLSAACAFAGAIISLIAGPHLAGYSEAMLPVTAGGFIYLAGSTLIPDLLSHVQPKDFLKELAAMTAGIAIMVALTWME